MPRTLNVLIGQSSNVLNAVLEGVDNTGASDIVSDSQAALNKCAANKIQYLYYPPGQYLSNSGTGSGGNAISMTVPPGVSVIGAGSDVTTFQMGAFAGNLFGATSTFTTTISVINTNASMGASTFTVDTTVAGVTVAANAAWTVGDTAFVRLVQNSLDSNEARQTEFVTVTAVTATTITIDTPMQWDLDIATSLTGNRRLIKTSTIAERMSFGGFHIVGNSLTRHGIQLLGGRQVSFGDITAYDIGSGIINTQWSDGCSGEDLYVYKGSAYANTSKGRVLSLSNCTNWTLNNINADYTEGAAVYVESYSRGIQINGLRINDRTVAASRNQRYHVFSGNECDVQLNNFTITNYDPANAGWNSPVSFGTGTGICQLNNTTMYMKLNQIRQIPASVLSGFFRAQDNAGVMRTWNMSRARQTTLTINLADGINKVAWLRDEMLVGYETYVSPGVTSAMLTTLTIGRTSGTNTTPAWTAGHNVRSDTYIGGIIYPMQTGQTSAGVNMGLKITATTAAAGGIPASSVVVLNIWTVPYNGQDTTANEPGSEQFLRWAPSMTV